MSEEQWMSITKPGQVKVGTKLRFTIGDEKYSETAKLILHSGTEREEIIYNKRQNYYLITSMAIQNKGSQKNVEYLGVASSQESDELCDNCGLGHPSSNCIYKPAQGERSDTERLDWIAAEYFKIDPFDMQSGGDDADVGWRISQYHMGKPQERVVAEVYRDDLRAAIDAAMGDHAPPQPETWKVLPSPGPVTGEALYMSRYGVDGAKWELNVHQAVWNGWADQLNTYLAGAQS